VVSAEIPRPQSASGFAPRLYRFLATARESMDVSLALIDPDREVTDEASAVVDELRSFSAPVPAWRRRGLRGQLLRSLIQYPFDPLPYQCHPRRVPGLHAFLVQQRPDVIVLYLPYLSHLVGHCPAGTPVIAMLEEPWEWVVDASLGPSPKDRWLARRETRRFTALYRRIDGRVAAAVALSDAEAAYFSEAMTAAKLHVIPHGIDTGYFRPAGAPPSDIDVLVVGKLRAGHNLDGALRTWEASAPKEWRWAFVGGIDADVAQRLRDAGCLVPGTVDDVRPYYERARCVLVPALIGRGVKTTSLQAWAMNRPLVTSPIGVQGLPATPGVDVMVGVDPAEMSLQIAAVLADPPLARRLADAGRATVERTRDSAELARTFTRLCLDVAEGSAVRVAEPSRVR
jgi:glycosyltransferase involved in cell wall biosynthesis